MKSVISSQAQVLDLRYLTLYDFSQYNTDVETTNAVYRITIPNFNRYVDVAYTPNSVLNVSANLLLLSSTADPTLLPVIPSGLYTINQSICPNNLLYTEYYFFNIAPELQTLACAVCANKDDKEKLDHFFDLKNQLELAKMLAERCGQPTEAIRIFNLTVKDLNIISSDCNC